MFLFGFCNHVHEWLLFSRSHLAPNTTLFFLSISAFCSTLGIVLLLFQNLNLDHLYRAFQFAILMCATISSLLRNITTLDLITHLFIRLIHLLMPQTWTKSSGSIACNISSILGPVFFKSVVVCGIPSQMEHVLQNIASLLESHLPSTSLQDSSSGSCGNNFCHVRQAPVLSLSLGIIYCVSMQISYLFLVFHMLSLSSLSVGKCILGKRLKSHVKYFHSPIVTKIIVQSVWLLFLLLF